MNDDFLKETINDQEPDFLEECEPVGGQPTYLCPECNDHELQRYDNGGKTMWKCFRCGYVDDVIGLYQAANNISDFREALKGAAEYYGLIGRGEQLESERKPKEERRKAQPVKEIHEEDLTEYINQCAARREAHNDIGCSYLEGRGISEETQRKFKIGYDPSYTDPRTGAKRIPESLREGRVIIPTSSTSIIARSVNPMTEYKAMKAGKVHLFNGEAIRDPRPLFVVEGEIDALSLIDLGFNAVGIGGTSGKDRAITAIKDARRREPVILALDNDKPGKDATEAFLSDMREKQIKAPVFVIGDNAKPGSPEAISSLYGRYKDANDRLQDDRDGLKNAAEEVVELTGDEAEVERYNLQNVSGHLTKLLIEIRNSKGKIPYKTGFKELDSVLSGGIRPKQVCYLGAISSLGKTTFLVQMADNMAESGRDVLYFSLETPEDELIAKIISRYTLERSIMIGRNTELAKKSYDVLEAEGWNNSSREGVENMEKAFYRLDEHGNHLRFNCSIGDANADDVRHAVEEHIRITGNHPAVFIDYLQIMKPLEKDRNGRSMKYSSDKAATDATVSALKHMAVDLEVPVIAISALNRDNYKEPINTAAFKESGGIEYGSDILIGLQYPGMDYRAKEKQNDRAQRINDILDKAAAAGRTGEPIDVELKILKNRNGRKGCTHMQYMCMFNRFKEIQDNYLQRQRRRAEAYDDFRL
jgi:replicative DNA helicase